MNDPIVGLELLKEDLVCVNGGAGEDGEVLKAHGVAIRLEFADKVDELGVDIGAGASVRGLGVDNV